MKSVRQKRRNTEYQAEAMKCSNLGKYVDAKVILNIELIYSKSKPKINYIVRKKSTLNGLRKWSLSPCQVSYHPLNEDTAQIINNLMCD